MPSIYINDILLIIKVILNFVKCIKGKKIKKSDFRNVYHKKSFEQYKNYYSLSKRPPVFT